MSKIKLELNEVDIDPIRTARLKKKVDKGDKKAIKEYNKMLKTKVNS